MRAIAETVLEKDCTKLHIALGPPASGTFGILAKVLLFFPFVKCRSRPRAMVFILSLWRGVWRLDICAVKNSRQLNSFGDAC